MLLVGPGCADVTYLFSIAGGEIDMLLNTRPIEDILAEGALDHDPGVRLRYLAEARRFAAGSLGLRAGDAYTLFFDTNGGTFLYKVTAAHKDRLEAYIWPFPIVGDLPYKGFFDRELARAEIRRLEDEGYDVLAGGIDGFSTGGWLPDPVNSNMLDRSPIDMVRLLVHELTHNTVYSANTTFNESLATFVEFAGTALFLKSYFGPDAEIVSRLANQREDRDRFNRFVFELGDELRALYDQPITREEKLLAREEVYAAAKQRLEEEILPELAEPSRYERALPEAANNAWLLERTRYNLNLTVFEEAYEAVDGNIPRALSVFRAAAAAEDPWPHLRNWVDEHQSP